MTKMTDDELIAKIRKEEHASLDYLGGDLSTERAENMEMYLGDKTRELAPIEGRSSVVSMDVQEAVESMMPYLMKVFTSGDEVVRFNPKNAEDVKQAEQETDYINHVVMNQNNFFLVATQWFKDALINKNAYVKYWWDVSEKVTEEVYEGITDEQMQMLLQDDDIEALEHEASYSQEVPQELIMAAEAGDEMAMQALEQAPMTHSVRVRVTNKEGKVVIEPCPSEECLVSGDERSIDPNSVKFFEHRQWKTISDIREMGYDIDDEIADNSDSMEFNDEWLSRQEYSEDIEADRNGATREVVYREAYILVDFDGDGIAERRKVCMVGDTILANEVEDLVPFANITPFIMPHKHIGRALADYVKDIQIIKSMILRNVMDNFYASNNGRHAIDADRVNLDDMLVSRPNGVVRTKGNPAGAIMPLINAPIGREAFPLMQYLDDAKENRTGITKYNQGMDADSLNKTASGISQIMSAAQQKQELIARTFAETGVKQLFYGVHALTLKHNDKPAVVRLRNEWIDVDPRQWKTRTDMTVAVGLGTGNKQEMLAQIMNILNVQKEALQIGVVTPLNIYESCIELTKNAGFKDGEKYWTDPSKQEQQPPQEDPRIVADRERLEFDKQKAMADYQLNQQKSEADKALAEQKMQQEIAIKQEEMKLEVALAREKQEVELSIHREKVMAEIALERERMQLEVAGMINDNQRQSIDGGITT